MYPYIFSVEIPWFNIMLEPRFYGLFYAVSLLISTRIVLAEVARRRINLSEDEAMNMTMLLFFAGLAGGRAYEVIFEWSNYYAFQPFWKVFAVWEGGLAIHGAILGGIIVFPLYCRVKKMSLPVMFDISAMCMILGQALGRWGNFTNGETAGPITEFWTGIVFPAGTAVDRYAHGAPVHPTMIYESLGNFLIFYLLWKLRLRNLRPGMLGAVYLLSYAVLRSFLTPLRMDNQYFVIADSKFLAAYAISLLLFAAGLFWIFKQKLWLTDEALNKKIALESAVPAKGVKNAKAAKKNKKR
jgi:phosphatidylglycerol:prolipoprotein diacylglycerol transferase